MAVMAVMDVPAVPMDVLRAPVVHQVHHNAWEKLPQPNADTLECLRAVYGPAAYPRSRKQAFALEFMRAGRNDGIIVLPTGGGKTR